MFTVNAYAAPPPPTASCPRPSSAATSARSDVLIEIKYAGICHSDIHTARGDWGEVHLPAGAGPRDRRRRRRGRLRGHQARSRRPRRRRLHGQLLPRVRELPGRPGAVLPQGQRPDLRRPSTATAPSPTAATPTHIVVDEDFVAAHPRGLAARRGRAAAVRRHHHLLAAAPLERRPRQEGRRRRHGRPRPHGRQDRRTRWAPRSPCCRSRCARRTTACSSAPTTTTPPATRTTFEELADSFDLIINTVSAPLDLGRLPDPAAPGRRPGQRRRPAGAAAGAPCSR